MRIINPLPMSPDRRYPCIPAEHAAHPTGICGYGQRNACGRLNRSALGVRAGLLTVWHGLASQHLLDHLQHVLVHVPQALLLHWRILGHRKGYELSIVP